MVSLAEAKLAKAQRKLQLLEANGVSVENIAKRRVLVRIMFCNIYYNL